MAYRMTELTPTVRVGINGIGELNVEVWDRPRQHPGAECHEVFIPGDALPQLFEYLRRNA